MLKVVDALLRFLFAAFWLAAAAGKAVEAERFAIAILAYDIVPAGWVDLFAWAVIGAEAAVGLLLASRRTLAWGAAAALGLLAVFTVAAVKELLAGDFHECGCKLPFLQATTIGPHLLLRNMALAVWAAFLLYRATGARAGEPLAAAAGRVWEARWRLAQTGLLLFLLVTVIHQRGINAKLLREGGYALAGGFTNRSPMEPGVRLPAFTGLPIDGGPPVKIRFGPGEPERIVILFSAACDACTAAAPDWNDWWRREGDRAAFLGICASGTEAARRFAALHALKFPVVTVLPDAWREFRTSVVPRVLRVSPDGVVTEVRDPRP